MSCSDTGSGLVLLLVHWMRCAEGPVGVGVCSDGHDATVPAPLCVGHPAVCFKLTRRTVFMLTRILATAGNWAGVHDRLRINAAWSTCSHHRSAQHKCKYICNDTDPPPVACLKMHGR